LFVRLFLVEQELLMKTLQGMLGVYALIGLVYAVVRHFNGNGHVLKGYDAGKKVSGIKRHIAVDTRGLPYAVAVTTPS
jgi:hypothetical protein